MKLTIGLFTGAAIVAGIAGCTPSPLDEDYWATKRPLGESLDAYQPTREPEPSASLPQASPVEEVEGDLVLRDALAAALLHNPDLARFGYDVRSAEARAVQAGLWLNPELGFEAENIGGSGDFEGIESAEVTLALSQTFPLGGDIQRRKDLARLQGRLAGWIPGAAGRAARRSHTTVRQRAGGPASGGTCPRIAQPCGAGRRFDWPPRRGRRRSGGGAVPRGGTGGHGPDRDCAGPSNPLNRHGSNWR